MVGMAAEDNGSREATRYRVSLPKPNGYQTRTSHLDLTTARQHLLTTIARTV